MDLENKTLWNDYRMAQPLYDRVVESSFLPRLGKGSMYIISQLFLLNSSGFKYNFVCSYILFYFYLLSAFCRQEEIDIKLLNIEHMITSLGKYIHSGMIHFFQHHMK